MQAIREALFGEDAWQTQLTGRHHGLARADQRLCVKPRVEKRFRRLGGDEHTRPLQYRHVPSGRFFDLVAPLLFRDNPCGERQSGPGKNVYAKPVRNGVAQVNFVREIGIHIRKLNAEPILAGAQECQPCLFLPSRHDSRSSVFRDLAFGCDLQRPRLSLFHGYITRIDRDDNRPRGKTRVLKQ